MGSVKAATKAKSKESSNTPMRTAGLRLIEKVNIPKERAEAPGRAGKHSTAHSGGATEARRLGNQRANQEHPAAKAKAAEQHRASIPAAEVFDNLSKTLAGHASQLPTEEQTREQEIRKSLVESLKHFDEDRTALAENLHAYKQVFKTQRQWTRVVTEIGAAIQVSARTVFRLLEDFESAQAGEVFDTMVDLSSIKGAPLTKEDRARIRARLAIRSFLEETPNNRKPQALADLLAEEAYQIWGARQPFQVEISPRPSRFTIDGRKRIALQNKDE